MGLYERLAFHSRNTAESVSFAFDKIPWNSMKFHPNDDIKPAITQPHETIASGRDIWVRIVNSTPSLSTD